MTDQRYTCLDRVTVPADIRKFSTSELRVLCSDVREFLIETVSKTGGHLGAGLGSVELAVALHYDRTGAPRVVAKGKGAIGEKIIEVAKAHDIPIEENEVLAGALSKVELGDEIPAELYKAVAEVLIFVLRLSGRLR